ncbi:hypothetical protein PR048_007930 [Dryococelus australis]|uniref:DDE-1 domain-containing protein n=1 Tax=Dryococelus australis TaxID=614101 RepID=A0ABQ9HVT8_9NEOP|nr:hypothetical protein PR048_007930 [Dryococelus australis]
MRTYKRKTQRGDTPPDKMDTSSKLVLDNPESREYSVRKIAKEFNIHFCTLSRYVYRNLRNELTPNWRTGNIQPCCKGTAAKSGWQTEETFLTFMKHFTEHISPCLTNPVLLLLDNNSSHVSFPVLDLCKASGVFVLFFPPHCSHRLQPLDITSGFSPEIVHPFPKALERNENPRRRLKRRRTAIITDTPKKKAIEKEMRSTDEKKRKKSEAQGRSDAKKTSKKNLSKEKGKSKGQVIKKKNIHRKIEFHESSFGVEEDTICLVCLLKYKLGEEWVQCTVCKH